MKLFTRSGAIFALFIAVTLIVGHLSASGIEIANSVVTRPTNGQNYERIHSLIITSSVTEGGLRGVCVRTTDVLTGRFREDTRLGIKREAEGFDGQVAWLEDSGCRVRREENDFAQTTANNRAYRNCLAYWFPHRFAARIQSLGQKKEGDSIFDIFSVQPVKGQPFELWFDATTHLHVRTIESGFYKTVTTYYSNFKPIQGMLFPFSTRINSGDARFDRFEEVEGIQLNPTGIDHSLAIPNEGRPDFTSSETFPRTVPFRLVSNLVIVDAVVNGKELPFILDSGGVNLLFPETVKEMGLTSEGQFSGFGGGQDEVTTSQVRIDALQLASMYFHPQVFMVYPFPALRSATGLPNLAGILGYEIFKRFVVRLDYPHRQATFSLPANYQYTGDGVTIPFHFIKTAIEVEGAIDSIPSRFIIDTGTTGSLILNSPWVNSHRELFPNAFQKSYSTNAAAGGNAQFGFASIASVSLGSRAFHNVIGALSLQTAGATANPYIDGMVGAEVFLNSTIIFDYSRQRMILEGEHADH